MNLKEFDDALAAAMNFFPGIEIKREQKECLKRETQTTKLL